MNLKNFVTESNRIEGITRTTREEILAHEAFVALTHPCIADIVGLVSVLQPRALLRDEPGRDVRVGTYYPPRGGLHVRNDLRLLLERLGEHSPYTAHLAYEALHPFTDGNGRSGRALWLWMMGGLDHAPLGFLHHWYYQSLAAPHDTESCVPLPSQVFSAED